MTISTTNNALGERLVDAREAAHCLNLPLYLLTHPCERERLQVPHYRVGKLVRFTFERLVKIPGRKQPMKEITVEVDATKSINPARKGGRHEAKASKMTAPSTT